MFVFFFKPMTAYEMLISDWSSDVCSSDLRPSEAAALLRSGILDHVKDAIAVGLLARHVFDGDQVATDFPVGLDELRQATLGMQHQVVGQDHRKRLAPDEVARAPHRVAKARSEEHTSELQSLMRISYAVLCLKKKNNTNRTHHHSQAE